MLAQLMHHRSSALRLFSSAAAVAGASFGFSSLSSESPDVMTPEAWRPLKLVSREQLTGGDRPTHLFRFEIPKNQPALPVASCLLTRAPVGKVKDDGTRAFVMRPYTPISPPDARHLDLAIKVYPDGKLTPYLANLRPGDLIDFKGPLPKLPIDQAAPKKAIGMIAGGTGLTPMLQVAEELLRTGYKGKISLIYANVSPQDIMLKDHVDALAVKHGNFSVHYVVDRVPAGDKWDGSVGYVTTDMLRANMPSPSDDALVTVCGPPGMMKVVSAVELAQ